MLLNKCLFHLNNLMFHTLITKKGENKAFINYKFNLNIHSPDQFGKQAQEHVSILNSAPFLQSNIGQAFIKSKINYNCINSNK